MNNLHAKSPCCREKIIKFGSRRRQCVRCKNTWRIRKKRRGRKKLRSNSWYVHRYLEESLRYRSSSRLSPDQFRYRIGKGLRRLLEITPPVSIPTKIPCVAVVDATIHKILGRYYTTYIVLIRPVAENTAIIYDTCTLPGYENGVAWKYVLIKRINPDLRRQIKALTCDGARIFPRIAVQNNWLLQRCHFHLLSALHSRLSGKRMRKRYRRIGKRITGLVRIVLTSMDEKEIASALLKLKRYQHSESIPVTVRSRILKGFLQEYQEYRTYLLYSDLNLPRTTGSCESMNSIIRRFLSGARGISSPAALDQWIRAIVAKRKTIRCNGTNCQPNFSH